MKKEHCALPLRQTPLADDACLARLGSDLINKGSCTAETACNTVRVYAYSWRYWLGSASQQCPGWLALSPDERFSASSVATYKSLLLATMTPSGALSKLKTLRTAAGHICQEFDPKSFDDAIAELGLAAKMHAEALKPDKLSAAESDLPKEDQDRLRQITEFGRVDLGSGGLQMSSKQRVEVLAPNARKNVRNNYLSLFGFILREAPEALATVGANRFTPELIRKYGHSIAARLSQQSAVAGLQKFSFVLSRLWPESNFDWIGSVIAEFKPPKADPIGLSALPDVQIPSEDQQWLDRAIELQMATDRAAVKRARRGGPAKLGNSAAEKRSFRYAVKWFFQAAAADDPQWLGCPLSVKLTKHSVEALIKAMEPTNAPRTISQMLDRLRRIFERLAAIAAHDRCTMAPDPGVIDWMFEEAKDLRRYDRKPKPKLPPVATEELVTAAEAELDRVKASIDVNRRSKIPWRSLDGLLFDYRDALVQLLESLLVLRAKNLAGKRRSKNLLRGPTNYHVIFDAKDTKTRRELYRIVPRRCTRYLDYFYDNVVPLMTQQISSDVAFPSRRGGALSKSGIQKSVPTTTHRLNGAKMPIKAFRTAAASGVARNKNVKPRLGQRVLGHTTPTMTEINCEAVKDVTAANMLASEMDDIVAGVLSD